MRFRRNKDKADFEPAKFQSVEDIEAEFANVDSPRDYPPTVPAMSPPPPPPMPTPPQGTPAPVTPPPPPPLAIPAPATPPAPAVTPVVVPQPEPATTPASAGPDLWVRPGKFAASLVPTGRYAGQSIVGQPGSLLEIERTLANPITGGHRPAVVVDLVDAGRIVIGAVSVRGALHYDSRTVRQDSYSLGKSEDGAWAIAAIADGVSEGALSHLGADTAAHQAVTSARTELARQGFESADWARVAAEVRAKVQASTRQLVAGKIVGADGTPVDPKTLSDEDLARAAGTTSELLVIAVKPSPAGTYSFARVVIAGDGSGLMLDPSRGWKPLSVGKNNVGGFANNAVKPLPLDVGTPVVQRGTLEPGQAVLLTTDGIGDFLVDGSTEVGGYLHQEWSTPISSVNLVRSASFVTYQSDDDRAVVIVWAS